MSVGTNIRARRYALNMTQQELADAMGYRTRSTIAKIESGENDVTQQKLVRFAQVLDTTVEALISGTGPLPAEVREDTGRAGGVRTAAVILAGGKSVRNHQNIPNQFVSILGKPVIVYCLEAYQRHPAVDDIYVVCLRGWENILTAYARQYQITKLRGLIPGAASGIASVENALLHLRDSYGPEDIVIFQESTRPMVTEALISKLLGACYDKGSANICGAMRDNVQFLVRGGKTTYLDRDAVVDLQSPEAYRMKVIQSVFDAARKRNHPMTESCCAMLRYNLGMPINFIEGSINNIKIVRQEDVAIVNSLLRQEEP